MDKSRLLVYCSNEKIKFSTRLWFEGEVTEFLKREKEDFSSFHIYSTLDNINNLIVSEIALALSIPVIGCIPYEGFDYKFSPYEQSLYKKIRSNLYHLKIISNKATYETYRKRSLYLANQTNRLLFLWDKSNKNSNDESFYRSILAAWKNKRNSVIHIDPTLKSINIFNL